MSDINNIKYKLVTYKRETCPPVSTFQPNIDATCAIQEKHIIYMSYFLTTILVNSPTNITLSELKGGKILNRGSFGYIYKPNFYLAEKYILIKIVTCIKENKNYIIYLDNEINIHKKISLYDEEHFMKLLGYFIKNENNQYEYKTIDDKYTTNRIRLSTKDSDFISDACEIYLLLEEAPHDLTNIISMEKRLDNSYYYKFINLIEFYKVSYKFLETDKKIFIHSDIKSENIVESKSGKLKFIDFGLSKLSDTFFLHNSDGTENILKLLFTIDGNPNNQQNPYDYNLCMVSPLFDIFSIILCIFELIIRRQLINISIEEINKIISYQITFYKSQQNNLWKLFDKLLLLFNSIYKFHQDKITSYYKNKHSHDSSGIFTRLMKLFATEPLQIYIKSYNMNEFKILDDENSPEYIDTGNNNLDSLNHLKNILEYLFKNIESISELEEVVIIPDDTKYTHLFKKEPISELEEVVIDIPQAKQAKQQNNQQPNKINTYYKFDKPITQITQITGEELV